jgi:regulator of extracellular matrix RemA (YlzA/DUF370 family)
MKKTIYLVILLVLITASCSENHFITDKSYRRKVEIQFESQKELAKNRAEQLFGVFNTGLSTRETEALKFLYAYSSLNDLADYNGDFFLQNVRSSFAARDTFNWGKTVPENLFRHFVLPVRVNNENLDSSRWVFMAELKDRVKKLSMKDAVLEVNHWCHEKVTYRASDGRTSSPLASVNTAWGRCGEESTFTVAALRSVGIPARQCYTPRWAHSDDNHAWVEVWVDGTWHFIGACEPEADLDLAWFTAPAKRAMLVNTTVFGDYEGTEEVLQKDPLFTRINVLQNYAPVKKVYALVTDAHNQAVDSASVEFQLYNYAEFYPLYKTSTAPDGLCSFITGYGDLVVWAAKDGKYGFQKLDVRKTDTVIVKLNFEPGMVASMEFDLVPPAAAVINASVSDLVRQRNSDRLAFEDKLRGGYESTFIDSSKSARFAKLVNLDSDTLWGYLNKSRGNWRLLTAFITQTGLSGKSLLFPILENISEKDLRDIDTAVLSDLVNHALTYSALTSNREEFEKYVLSPRVDNEWLKPFRLFFQSNFDAGFIKDARKDPMKIANWLRDNVALNKTANYSRAPITPVGVYEMKAADGHSVDLCFVAICRSFGIGARLDPSTKIPVFLTDGKWNEAYLYDKKEHAGAKGAVTLTNPSSNSKKPEYTTNYTLEEFKEGFFRTLDYEASSLVQNYPCTIEVPAGPCMLVTGNRLTDGTVISQLKIFEVKAGESTSQSIVLRKNQLPLPEYGKINPALFSDVISSGRIIAWIDPDKEPTKHLLADLRQKKNDFDQWKGRLVMVFPTEEQMKSFVAKEATLLPAIVSYSFQSTFPVRPSDLRVKTGELKSFPVVIYINPKGVINYLSEGYKIGICEELLTLIK